MSVELMEEDSTVVVEPDTSIKLTGDVGEDAEALICALKALVPVADKETLREIRGGLDSLKMDAIVALLAFQNDEKDGSP